MKNVAYISFTLYLILSITLSAETHIGGDIEGGVWNLEGSPYIVDETVVLVDNAELRIEPGVDVRFTPFTGLVCRNNVSIIAEGTPEDSIRFNPVGEDNWRCLIYDRAGGTGIFAYCSFFGSFGWFQGQGAICGPSELEVRHSTFLWCDTGISGIRTGIIEDCYFNVQIGGLQQVNDSIVVRRCVFENIRAISVGYAYVENCLFINCTGVSTGPRSLIDNCLFLECPQAVNGHPRIRNSIFLRNNCAIGSSLEGDYEDISNNCFFENNLLFWRDSLDGVGLLVHVNTNGDSTDIYGNLFMDPRLAMEGVFPEMYYPTEDSPCIDAGNPDSDPDPDSTLADIGPFFFPQCNIRVNPIEVEFANAQTGLRFEESIEIRNVGLRLLNIIDISLTPDDTPFRFAYDWGENAEILPDSSSIVYILFDPQQEGVYEAILSIESNDRDEGIVEVNISGNALTIFQQPEITPYEFGMATPYPNPFNSSVQLRFTLATESFARLIIYDLYGREVAILNDGELTIGNHVSTWQADDFPTGLYFARLNSGDHVKTVKLTLIK